MHKAEDVAASLMKGNHLSATIVADTVGGANAIDAILQKSGGKLIHDDVTRFYTTDAREEAVAEPVKEETSSTSIDKLKW